MNAASLLAFNRSAAAAAESLRPAVIQIGPLASAQLGETLLASTGGVREEQQLSADGAGLVLVRVITFRVRCALLPTRPASGFRVWWADTSESYRIESVHTAPGDPCYTLRCVGLTK